jgi:hypothetical protein
MTGWDILRQFEICCYMLENVRFDFLVSLHQRSLRNCQYTGNIALIAYNTGVIEVSLDVGNLFYIVSHSSFDFEVHSVFIFSISSVALVCSKICKRMLDWIV